MLFLNFNPFPELHTPRLLLRCLENTDAPAILDLRSDETVNKFLDRPKARTLDDAEKFIAKIIAGVKNDGLLYWAISHAEDRKLLGTVCLWNISQDDHSAEVGYELLPSFQGKGIMQEALAAVIDFAFNTIKVQKIHAVLHMENLPSIKLLLKHHFVKEVGDAIKKHELAPKMECYSRFFDKGEITL